MKCPRCNVSLLMMERQGVEVDYCPECRGVWLDRGELDKIIEKSVSQVEPVRDRVDDRREDDHEKEYEPGKKRRRGGFLSELFD